MQLVGNVHVAAGNAEDIGVVLNLLREADINTTANPDIYLRTYRNFGIDQARDLTERASARAFAGRRVFVIAADSLTHEAQNALLKTLEEPAGNALFIFLVPAPDLLLPTLRSRAQMLSLPNAHSRSEPVVDARKFLSASPSKRLDMLKPLLEKSEEDKRDLGAIGAFLASLERSLSSRAQETSAREGLAAVYRARRYLNDRGALVKPLLEHVALLI